MDSCVVYRDRILPTLRLKVYTDSRKDQAELFMRYPAVLRFQTVNAVRHPPLAQVHQD